MRSDKNIVRHNLRPTRSAVEATIMLPGRRWPLGGRVGRAGARVGRADAVVAAAVVGGAVPAIRIKTVASVKGLSELKNLLTFSNNFLNKLGATCAKQIGGNMCKIIF